MVGAELAAVAGAWFALGTVLSPIWPAASSLDPGTPAGTTVLIRQLEHLGFFTGLGVVIVFVAALALGRLMVFAVRDRQIALDREPTVAEPDTVTGEPATARTTTSTTSTRPGQGSLHSFGRWLVARRS
jgi:hypothetical protein